MSDDIVNKNGNRKGIYNSNENMRDFLAWLRAEMSALDLSYYDLRVALGISIERVYDLIDNYPNSKTITKWKADRIRAAIGRIRRRKGQ